MLRDLSTVKPSHNASSKHINRKIIANSESVHRIQNKRLRQNATNDDLLNQS
jgi:hypothetical protein